MKKGRKKEGEKGSSKRVLQQQLRNKKVVNPEKKSYKMFILIKSFRFHSEVPKILFHWV